MNSILRIFSFALVACISFSSAKAQYVSSKYEIGFNVGTLVYQGDLSNNRFGDSKTVHPAVGLQFSRILDSYFSLRGNLTLGKLSADESRFDSSNWRSLRNFKFSTPVTELTATMVFHPFGNASERKITPYFYAGGGVTFLNIKRDWRNIDRTVFDDKSKPIIGLGTDTLTATPRTIGVLPVGAGLKIALSDQLSLNTDAGYRFTATDYLDGFKYAGNENKRDYYYGVSIGLSYRFGSYRCPAVR